MKINSKSGPASPKTSSRGGQSLVEILVAFGIVAIVLGAVVTGITITLRSNLASRLSRSGSVVLQELMDRARITSAGDWHSFYNPTDKTLPTYVVSDAGAFNFINGSEGILEGDILSGLVGHWKLDEAQGIIAYDSAPGTLNKGTLTNGPVATADCKVGGCLTFDGADDYISYTQTSGSKPTGSIGAWIFADVNDETLMAIADPGSAGANGAFLHLRTSNKVSFQYGDGSAPVQTEDPTVLGVGTWVHYAATWDSAGAKLYRNGVLVTTTSTEPSINFLATGYIGSDGGSLRYWDGKLDDVRLYNRALSSTEIDQMFESRVYVRSFTAEDVERNPGGNIITDDLPGEVDPSTQKINGTVVWGQSQLTATEYLTRSNSRVDVINDWSDASTYSSQSNLNLSNPNEATLVED